MGTTVRRRAADVTAVPEVSAPIIEIRENWSDEWTYDSGLELIHGTAYTTAHDLGRLEFRSRYGQVKVQRATDFVTKERRNIIGWWVRLRLIGEFGRQASNPTVWVGKVSSVVPSPFLASSEQAGVQTWVAHEALQILRKIHVSESYWEQDNTEQFLGWVPGMNRRAENGLLVGNRTLEEVVSGDFVDSHLYGGTSLWSRLDYLKYIINRFVDESETDGPTWTIGGQFEILDAITDTIPWGTTQTVAEIVRKLISTRLGIDYLIVPTDAGFEIRVFALTGEEITFGGATLPLNPNTMSVATAQYPNLESATIETKNDHKYSSIKVIGRRIVVCCSLWGEPFLSQRYKGWSLKPKWTTALEDEYKAGAGPDETEEVQAAFRQRDRFRAVYQMFGAPEDWDLHEGLANPELLTDGTVDNAGAGNFQTQVRRTLNWLPLLEGHDYSGGGDVLVNTEDHEPAGLPPFAIIFDDSDEETQSRWVNAEHVVGQVQPLPADWGILLNGSPNHKVAKNHTTGFADQDGAEDVAKWDYGNMIATVAFESDHRLGLLYQINTTPSDGQLVIEVPDAEYWYLAPHTMVGINKDGVWFTGGPNGRVIRNDTSRMLLIMAGAIARYAIQRAMAVLTFRGLAPYSNLLGHILDVVEFESGQNRIAAPITCVEWTGGDNPTTIVRTGFAQ